MAHSDEKGAIARAIRTYLQREIEAGRGELWAVDAAARPGRAGARSEPLAQAAAGGGVAAAAAAQPLALLDEPDACDPLRAHTLPADDSMAKVAAEIQVCPKCTLSQSRTQAVPGNGTGAAGIVFVGEGPGAEEDKRGLPFVGAAGKLLDRILQAMDDQQLIPGVRLNRDTVYVTNIVKCRPPQNRVPLPQEIQACSPYLRRQLVLLRPRIICCLGKTAAEYLVGAKGSLGGMRGTVHRYGESKLIVTYHPAALLRNPAYKRPLWEDMQLLAREYRSD